MAKKSLRIREYKVYLPRSIAKAFEASRPDLIEISEALRENTENCGSITGILEDNFPLEDTQTARNNEYPTFQILREMGYQFAD